MPQAEGVFLDGLADFSVKDKLFLLRAVDFCPFLRVVGFVPK